MRSKSLRGLMIEVFRDEAAWRDVGAAPVLAGAGRDRGFFAARHDRHHDQLMDAAFRKHIDTAAAGADRQLQPAVEHQGGVLTIDGETDGSGALLNEGARPDDQVNLVAL